MVNGEIAGANDEVSRLRDDDLIREYPNAHGDGLDDASLELRLRSHFDAPHAGDGNGVHGSRYDHTVSWYDCGPNADDDYYG